MGMVSHHPLYICWWNHVFENQSYRLTNIPFFLSLLDATFRRWEGFLSISSESLHLPFYLFRAMIFEREYSVMERHPSLEYLSHLLPEKVRLEPDRQTEKIYERGENCVLFLCRLRRVLSFRLTGERVLSRFFNIAFFSYSKLVFVAESLCRKSSQIRPRPTTFHADCVKCSILLQRRRGSWCKSTCRLSSVR